MPAKLPQAGRDPVFLFMIAAVLLAVGSSFMLRAAVRNYGPSSAQAASGQPVEKPLQKLDEESP